jgi:hypothetical protein
MKFWAVLFFFPWLATEDGEDSAKALLLSREKLGRMGRNAPDWGARLLGMMNEDLSV